MLEAKVDTFVTTELQNFQRILSLNDVEESEAQRTEEHEREDEGSREAFLKFTLSMLRSMKEHQLADCLQTRAIVPTCQSRLKSSLKQKFGCIFEGIPMAGKPSLLNDIYTELYISEGGSGMINDEHEIRQIESSFRQTSGQDIQINYEDIFHPSCDRPVRTVLTKGVAGIGKTVLMRKFTLDWAEDKTNRSIHFTFPFAFRELNVLKEKEYSLIKLLHLFFVDIKEAEICNFDDFAVVFILDGLDECRLPLDFYNNKTISDVTQPAAVDVLLTNLICGNLLPSARLWITTRPAAASVLPAQWVDRVTEVRGFTDTQKMDYFKKRFKKEEQAERIIAHIKQSRSIHIMCHIPIFCWITASVLEPVLRSDKKAALPKTLTEMYICFLLVELKLMNEKLNRPETDTLWNTQTCETTMALGKLAFDQLQKGNLIFYESDLIESKINTSEASLYSGLFTQIFKEECGLFLQKVFCFVHLSIQEFLAALYVFVTFFNTGVNVLSELQPRSLSWSELFNFQSKEQMFFKSAVKMALKSQNGHLDLFLRFLLGLSMKSSHVPLQGLLKLAEPSSYDNSETVQYIKQKIQENPSPERCINLFHSLYELKDISLVEEIQQCLSLGRLSTDKLSPAQWSALVFLLSSEKDMEVFDLRKYSASEKGLLRLLPVLHISKAAVLSDCNLSDRSCEALVSVLTLKTSSLRVLDLSNNSLMDSGVKTLSSGLASQHCKLEILRLSGCQVTEEGCAALAHALSCNPFHLKELDLSYNYPGDLGTKQLMAALENPRLQLTTLSLEHGGIQRLKPGQKKYACELMLDPNTANNNLALSEDNRRVTLVQRAQPYPDHPHRFGHWNQVMCKEGLTGRCYWEVDCEGWVNIGVAYKRIKRKGQDDDSWIGQNDASWSLVCHDKFSASHKNQRIVIPMQPSGGSSRVAVYLDWHAGALSFYRVSSNALVHIHTFHSTFTEPLYPAFGFVLSSESSLSLCQM
ncbi:protein NLRC3-like [Takifugu rubripes]|uniref:protein NLRC3-like n=1 Tax=Takifugu rubripes TaxID=31033 RepID=UPI001145590E|nr:protein NLRC3-like [Takifugu rubripes]